MGTTSFQSFFDSTLLEEFYGAFCLQWYREYCTFSKDRYKLHVYASTVVPLLVATLNRGHPL